MIPTWNGEDVLRDAIHCALAQTEQNLEVIIAVDFSEDSTSEIAADAVRQDNRVSAILHAERIGWVRNVNSGLAKVSGQYFCLYFHDDLMDPTYLETLHQQIEAEPGRVAAYCSVIQDSGAHEYIDKGCAYFGKPADRLLTRLLCLPKGAPFRALTRASLLEEGLRLPEGSFDGFHAQLAYLVRLVAAGDVAYSPKALYRRRNWRQGALTKGWKNLPVAQCVADLQLVAKDIAACVELSIDDDGERQSILAAVHLTLAEHLRVWEVNLRVPELVILPDVFEHLDKLQTIPERFDSGKLRILDRIEQLEQSWNKMVESN